MNAVIAATLIGVVTLFVYAATRSGAPSAPRGIHPSIAYGGVWTALLLLYPVSGLHSIAITEKASITFVASYLFFSLGVLLVPRRTTRLRRLEYVVGSISSYYWRAVVLLGISLSIQVFQLRKAISSAGGLAAIFGRGGLSFRRAYSADRSAALAAGFQGGTLLLAVAVTLTFLGAVSVFWAGYYAANGHLGRAAVPLAMISLFGLLTLQRAAVLYPLGMFFFSWRYHSRLLSSAKAGRTAASRKTRFAIALFGLLTAAAIIVPSAIRSQSSTTVDTQGGIWNYFLMLILYFLLG